MGSVHQADWFLVRSRCWILQGILSTPEPDPTVDGADLDLRSLHFRGHVQGRPEAHLPPRTHREHAQHPRIGDPDGEGVHIRRGVQNLRGHRLVTRGHHDVRKHSIAFTQLGTRVVASGKSFMLVEVYCNVQGAPWDRRHGLSRL